MDIKLISSFKEQQAAEKFFDKFSKQHKYE